MNLDRIMTSEDRQSAKCAQTRTKHAPTTRFAAAGRQRMTKNGRKDPLVNLKQRLSGKLRDHVSVIIATRQTMAL
jgi:hypothetical protein